MKNVIIKMDFIPKTCATCPVRKQKGIHSICSINEHILDFSYKFKHRDNNCPIKGEIINCKDCKYSKSTDNENKPIFDESLLYCTIHNTYVNKNYYCATGIIGGEENG